MSNPPTVAATRSCRHSRGSAPHTGILWPRGTILGLSRAAVARRVEKRFLPSGDEPRPRRLLDLRKVAVERSNGRAAGRSQTA